LRGDFVGKALAYRPLSDRLQDAQINLGPMTREELERAIRKPADKIQLEFESGLVWRILDAVGDEPGNLPLLEFVLKELWERRRGRVLLNEVYDTIGGLQGAVATKADALFKGFSSAEQTILQRIFLRIVRPAKDGLDTRRRAAFTELPSEGAELVLKLANERLLVTNQSASGLERTVEVAHEALISNWSTLRVWVNEDREFLLWRDRLGTLLTEWERAQESDEALLRGPLLTEAQKWFDQRSQDLSDEERKFITASRAVAEKRRQQQAAAAKSLRRLAWVLAAVALVAVGGAIFGFWQRNEAEIRKQDSEVAKAEAKRQEAIAKENANKEKTSRNAAEEQARIANEQRVRAEQQTRVAEEQTRIAESRRLAAESTSVLTKYPQRSVLLAIEAVKSEQPLHGVRVAADEQSLRDALGFIGGRLVARADGPIKTVAISPDNRWLVTGSLDKTARLWDLSAKDPAANSIVLHGHEGPLWAVAISPDNRWVVTGSFDNTARLWDLSAKDPAASPVVLRGHEGGVMAVAISPDNRWVVTGSLDNTARLWDLSAKDPAANPVVLRGHEGWIRAVAISPDNRWVVTGSFDNTARLWDLSAKDPAANPVVLRGHEERVWR
jgi:hypothetical protein